MDVFRSLRSVHGDECVDVSQEMDDAQRVTDLRAGDATTNTTVPR